MPVPSPIAWSTLTTRLVVAICAMALLATAVLGSAEPAAANALGNQISSSRQGQNYYQAQMRAQDRLLVRLQRQIKSTKRGIKQSRRGVKRGKRLVSSSKRKITVRRARLKSVMALHDDPAEATKPWRYKKRLRKVRVDLRVAVRRKASVGRQYRRNVRALNARRYRLRVLKRQRSAAIYRREVAEGGLASRIVQMTRLAAARVENQSAVSLSAGGGSFSWPSAGRIAQTYGCTGFRLNPRRGSCRHFHDGLDIVAGYGSAVRAAAVGVVAYAGWNPWDEGGRAWIVVVVHPDGFVTRYGHLIPTRRARAGALVHTGQAIGKMGNTGKSTGTHLHFELLRGNRDVNPYGYLPAGGAKIKIDKKSTKKGVAKAKRKAKARTRAAARKQVKQERKARRRAAAKARQQPLAPVCVVTPIASVADQSYPYAITGVGLGAPDEPAEPCEVDASAAEPADTDRPDRPNLDRSGTPSQAPAKRDTTAAESAADQGVRLPSRGTSPIPS